MVLRLTIKAIPNDPALRLVADLVPRLSRYDQESCHPSTVCSLGGSYTQLSVSLANSIYIANSI